MSENRTAVPDLSALAEADAEQLAGMVAELPDEQLAEGFKNPEARSTVLGEVRGADYRGPQGQLRDRACAFPEARHRGRVRPGDVHGGQDQDRGRPDVR